jgi:hypothetical protein
MFLIVIVQVMLKRFTLAYLNSRLIDIRNIFKLKKKRKEIGRTLERFAKFGILRNVRTSVFSPLITHSQIENSLACN